MFGFTKEQVQVFKTRYNKNQLKLATGIEIKPKVRLRKSTGDGEWACINTEEPSPCVLPLCSPVPSLVFPLTFKSQLVLFP